MSHTTRFVNLGNTALAQVTFTAYTSGVGGESFTLAEFGLTGSLSDVWFIQTTDAFGRQGNATGVQYVGGGKVKLVFPTGEEFPTTASMSLSVFVIVQGS